MEMRLHPVSDRISNLPDHVIETILVRLPIREAVRTSVLSHKWRYKWATIPELVFDENSIYDEDVTVEDLTIHIHKFVNFIDRVLLLHKGPVLKFKFTSSLVNHSFIDAWILFLSRNGVKELILDIHWWQHYRVPYSFFSCQAITCLDLSWCILEPPSVFKGFSALKSLDLQRVTVSEEVFETMISNCIALERLRLVDLNGCTRLKIRGLNLQNFYFDGELTHICLVDAPQISFVSISLRDSLFKHVGRGDSCNLVQALGPLTGLEKLFIQFLRIGNIPARIPVVTYDRLKCISVIMKFEDLNETLIMLCLLQSSPNLHKLDIFCDTDVVTELVEDFWESQVHLDCSMNHLRMVTAFAILGTRPEIHFIKFLLANSPVLETLNVTQRLDKKDDKNVDKMKMLEELLRFHRASASAEIVYESF